MKRVVSGAYFPLLTSPANQADWSQLMSKDITDQLNTFMSNVQIVKGQVSGDTVVPLPFEKDTAQGNDDKQRRQPSITERQGPRARRVSRYLEQTN